MGLRLKRQPLFFALAVCIAFSVVFAGIVVADIHDCTDTHNSSIEESCVDCVHIEIAKSFFKCFQNSICFSGCFDTSIPVSFKNAKDSLNLNSLILLKVRHNT